MLEEIAQMVISKLILNVHHPIILATQTGSGVDPEIVHADLGQQLGRIHKNRFKIRGFLLKISKNREKLPCSIC